MLGLSPPLTLHLSLPLTLTLPRSLFLILSAPAFWDVGRPSVAQSAWSLVGDGEGCDHAACTPAACF